MNDSISPFDRPLTHKSFFNIVYFSLNFSQAHTSLTQLNKRIPAEILAQDMKALRLALTTAISREKYKKNVQIHKKMGCYVVPGFCIKKGLAPILPVFLYGLTYGSPELRESSAAGMGEVLAVSTDDAVKPFLMKVTGPLIRVLG